MEFRFFFSIGDYDAHRQAVSEYDCFHFSGSPQERTNLILLSLTRNFPKSVLISCECGLKAQVKDIDHPEGSLNFNHNRTNHGCSLFTELHCKFDPLQAKFLFSPNMWIGIASSPKCCPRISSSLTRAWYGRTVEHPRSTRTPTSWS